MGVSYRASSSSQFTMMEGLHEAGAIDNLTLREFDEACLAPATPLQLEEIKAVREAQLVSQPVFARYLNVCRRTSSSTGSEGRSGLEGQC